MGNGGSAVLSVSLTVADGHASFWYFLSSDEYDAEFTFAIDGSPHVLGQTSEWTRFSTPVAAGTHTFAWSYQKYASEYGVFSDGFDRAWIDAIASGDVPLPASSFAMYDVNTVQGGRAYALELLNLGQNLVQERGGRL